MVGCTTAIGLNGKGRSDVLAAGRDEYEAKKSASRSEMLWCSVAERTPRKNQKEGDASRILNSAPNREWIVAS
jgi:hypothetical protein